MLKDFIVQFDTNVTAYVQHWPNWLQTPMVIFTTLGSPISMICIAAAVGAIAWQHSHMRVIVSMGTALVAMGVNTFLRHYIHRTRPDTLYVSHMWFATSSFPSGHAFGSMVVLGLVAYLATQYLPSPWQYIAPSIIGILILVIGLSRIYLGAHYPTDVIAGWILGAIVLAAIIVFLKP